MIMRGCPAATKKYLPQECWNVIITEVSMEVKGKPCSHRHLYLQKSGEEGAVLGGEERQRGEAETHQYYLPRVRRRRRG